MKYTLLAVAAALLLGCANQNNLGYQGETNTGYNTGYVVTAPPPTSPAETSPTPDTPMAADKFDASVTDTVIFPEDQASLTPQAEAILDAQARFLAPKASNVMVEGHADELGTREYNIALGAKRASAVRDYLVSRGVDYGRIKTTSYGKERPAQACSEESCWAQNRRAVTVIR